MDMPAPVRIFSSLASAGKAAANRNSKTRTGKRIQALCGAYVMLRTALARFIRAGLQSTGIKEGEIKMKTGFLASAAIAISLLAVPAQAAEYVTILLEKVVDRTPDQTWAKIGGYCAIQT